MRVVRGANLSFVLPSTWVEDERGTSARFAMVDARSFEASLARLLDGAPADLPVALAVPLVREGGRGLVGRLSGAMRRLAPMERVEACEALRHAGITRVRVVDVEGALGLAVLSGTTTAA